MIRLFHVHFPGRTVFLAACESVLILSAMLAVEVAWSGSNSELVLRYEHGFLKAIVASLVCVLCMYYYDLYDSSVLNSRRAVLTRLVQVLGTVCLCLSLLYYIYPLLQLHRGLFLSWIVVAGVSLAAGRQLFFVINKSPRLVQRAVLLGDGPLAASLAGIVGTRHELGMRLVGYIGEANRGVLESSGLRHLGRAEDLASLVARERISRVILANGDQQSMSVDTLWRLKTSGLLVEDAADVYEAITGRLPIESLGANWLVFSRSFRVSRLMLLSKRAVSIVLSAAGLLISLPFLVLIALAIRLDSKGKVIFRQQRIGREGKPFTLYKFRTMREDPNGNGSARPTSRGDERITRVGRWLRRVRLDELPQLYNILRGDMYFVGPRPFVPAEEQEYSREIPLYSLRWTIKPGATGWAQVQQGYCESLEDNEQKLGYDLFYVKNMSVGLDLLILFQTIKILLLGRGSR